MSLRGIDLNLLVSLDALLAERNVTRAARRMGLSQPAMSAQLTRLRELFQDPLLIASPRGMLPTARALALQPLLADHLAGLEDLLAVAGGFDPATAETTFRIAASDSIQAILGGRLVARLAASAPASRIALIQPVVATLARQLEAGDVDVVIGSPAALLSTWRSRPLFEEHFVCVVRAGHPDAGGGLDLDRYAACDHLLVSPAGGGFSGVVDERLAVLGRRRRVAVSIQDFLVAQRLLAQTDLVATLPSRVAGGFGPGFAILAPPLDVPGFVVRLAWHPRTDRDPAREWLRREIAAVASELEPGPLAPAA